MATGPKLKFCPESNDLLYPKEDRERKVLIFHCRNCGYQEDADPSNYCVYRCALSSQLPLSNHQTTSGSLCQAEDMPCSMCTRLHAPVSYSLLLQRGNL